MRNTTPGSAKAPTGESVPATVDDVDKADFPQRPSRRSTEPTGLTRNEEPATANRQP